MDNVLVFKPKVAKQEPYLLDSDDLIDTTGFNDNYRDIGYINGKQGVKPKTQYEHLFLTDDGLE